MSYRTDPWMKEDEIQDKNSKEDMLSYKHSFFIFSGSIASKDILTSRGRQSSK